MVLLPLLFCFALLTYIDHGTNPLSWMPYDNLGPAPLGRLEYIRHSCQKCAHLSGDTLQAISEWNRTLDNFGLQKHLTTIIEKLQLCDSSANILGNQTQLINEIIDSVKVLREDLVRIIGDKMSRDSLNIEEIHKKLNFLLEGKQREKEDIIRREAIVEEKEKEIARRMNILESKEKEIKEMEIAFKVREVEAERKFIEAKKSEEFVKEQQTIVDTKMKKLKEDEAKYEKKKEKLMDDRVLLSNITLVFLAFAVGIAVLAACYLCRSSSSASSDREPPKFDVCHLSLTRERRDFFRREVLPRLSALNIHPHMEYCILMQPSDFNSIPKAKAYVVHWASQRHLIFSHGWMHRGLLRALGRKPFFIMVCDQEQTEPMPPDDVYDHSFGQIQSEQELREAASAKCLLTYRRGESLNRAQEEVLKNWMNASIGEDAFKGEVAS